LNDGPEAVDVGQHQMRFVDETARIGAPLALRFAALMHKIGKAGTPREIWPSHYKHEQRAHALLDALARRIEVPADALALTRLAIDECDRVHRASDMRAGALATLLDRVGAVGQPQRFEQLLLLCTCDWAANAGHCAADYPKAPRLRRALAAYAATNVEGLDADAALHARAASIDRALRGAPAID
jgi:tRNA nucleotidyltransferase (CCA-adding enzyme)